MSVYTGLLIAIFAVSWASILVRWCGGTPALVISFYRMFWSAFLFTVLQLRFNPTALRYKGLHRRSKLLIGIAGLFLAAHFWTWIASVQLTTIAHALILGSTHPVFALLFAPLLLKERSSWRAALAAVVTMIGVLIIAGQDFQFAHGNLQGDILAVFSALFVTFYIFVARHQREKIDLIPYLIGVYTSASFILLVVILAKGLPLFSYPIRIHGIMLLLALVPTGIGHSLINWAARKIEAYKVNFSILGEPVFASLLAFFIFGEKPYGLFYVGAVFIVAGIFLSLFSGRARKISPNRKSHEL